MTDLLTPDVVRAMELKAIWPYQNLARLCRDYITLWDERDKALRCVTQLEQEIGALLR